ncbi:MAG: hypothetical protein KDD48_05085 [Bdellovibrionales bacterium]|nr:hypothetical protein [Bdellovibrionales bacterium]
MKARPAVGQQNQIKITPAILDENLLNDDFLSELDVAFDAIKMSTKRTSKRKRQATKKTSVNLDAAQKTFLEVSRTHLRPITRYVKAIERGITSRELCKVIYYVIKPMSLQTKKIGLLSHWESMVQLEKLLKSINDKNTKNLSDEDYQGLKKVYQAVEKAFDLTMRGHSTAVLNVVAFYQTLQKSKKVDEKNIEKLFAIGIPSISMLRKSSIQELSSLSGIPESETKELREIARNFTLFELV